MKTIFKHILIIIFCCSFFTAGNVFATDEEGCLICHRYPGLVKREKGEVKFKALHIDEEKFFASKHGKFSCRKCHTKIYSVPHTGQLSADCTTACHRTAKDLKLIKEFNLAGFHKDEQSYIVELNDGDSCRVCHPLYPHDQDKVVRAVLNMHTGFMACEVCHIKKLRYSNITYGWKDTIDVKFHGKPFGNYYNPETGKARQTENAISRIVPFTTDEKGKRLLMNTWDTDEAKKFNSAKISGQEEKKESLAHFHRDIDKKEVSVACEECHSSNGILDFRELGFDEGKAKNLINMDIKGLITKYKTFYMPELFGD